MNLDALGYVGIRTKNLDDWASYGTRFLGMQLVDKSRGTLALRMDDRKQRVLVHDDDAEGPSFYGWEVADAAALEALAAHLEKSGISVARGSRALADERRVKDLIVFADPIGNRLEAFHGAETATDAFKPGRSISGYRTGPLGMGHAVLTAERLDEVLPFYTEILNFKLTDYFTKPFAAYFFHVNARHHSLAFINTGKNGIHHLMVELCYLDDVGQGYDIALRKPEMIGTTLGATSTITSPRSIHGRRRASCSSTAGAAAPSIRRPGCRSCAPRARVSGAMIANGSRPRRSNNRATCALPLREPACASRST